MEKYNEQENDKYLLENNLLGVKTMEELAEAEAFAFSLRAAQLEKVENVIDSFTEERFKKLHYHLFQDIYPFAGQFRNVQLMKGNTRSCRLAYFKSEFNMLHPFREGNGRTIRIFIHAFALLRGVKWEYENMDKEIYIQAMIQSATNTELLKKLFLETIRSTNDRTIDK